MGAKVGWDAGRSRQWSQWCKPQGAGAEDYLTSFTRAEELVAFSYSLDGVDATDWLTLPGRGALLLYSTKPVNATIVAQIWRWEDE